MCLSNPGAESAHASRLESCTRPAAGRCRGEIKAAMSATGLAASHGYAAGGTLAIARPGYKDDRQQDHEHNKAARNEQFESAQRGTKGGPEDYE